MQATHDAAHCGNSSNQVIFDDDGDKIGDRMIETGTDGLGNLTCTIYWDPNYREIRDIKTVNIEIPYLLTTTASDGRTWNHMGKVFATAEGPSQPLIIGGFIKSDMIQGGMFPSFF